MSEIQPMNQNSTTNDLTIQIVDLMIKSNNVVLGFKLDGNNSSLWARLMRVAIGSRGKSRYITGQPPPRDRSDPTYPEWEETDLMVFSWLISNMENKLLTSFAQYQTAKAVWDNLAIIYGSGTADPFQIYDLEVRANKVKQGSLNLEDYWNNLQALWLAIDQRDPNTMDCCEQGIAKYKNQISNRRLYQFLSGLDNKYDGIKRDILKEAPIPSVKAAFAKVRREAARQQILLSGANPTNGEASQSGLGTGLAANRPKNQKPKGIIGRPNPRRVPSKEKEDRSKLSIIPSDGMKITEFVIGVNNSSGQEEIGTRMIAGRIGEGRGGGDRTGEGARENAAGKTKGLSECEGIPQSSNSALCDKTTSKSFHMHSSKRKSWWIFDCGATDTMTFEQTDITEKSVPLRTYVQTASGDLTKFKEPEP